MMQLLENGDKYVTSKTDTQTNSDHPSLHLLLTKLNIPVSCFNNQQLRQHYLEEYSAKYSKAKHLLSNARKKQRKIIITYYEEKNKEDNINQLQTVKDTLLEENEKIKKFKQALKDKLIIYHQRIQFLKDTEFWSIQQLPNHPTESIDYFHTSSPPDSPTFTDSRHLLYDHPQIRYSDHLLDDSCPTISDECHFKRKLEENHCSGIDDNIVLLSRESDDLLETSLNHREQSHTELISKIDETIESLISKRKSYLQWLKDDCQFDRWKIVSTMLIIALAVLLVIFLNDLLEYFLIYLTKPSEPMATSSLPKSFFKYWLSNVYNYTMSWLLPFTRILEFSV